MSYGPVIDLLKSYFTIQDRDDPRTIRERVTGKLLTLDRALESTLPALLALLDVPIDDAAWRALDPPQRRQRTLDAVKRLVVREAREQPLLLIFEDLHWIDSETQALLDSLVETLGSARLLLLVSYRPQYRHPWGSKTCYSQVRLGTLSAEPAGEFLDALLGEDSRLAPLKQLLVRRGNPFFLEETGNVVIANGVVGLEIRNVVAGAVGNAVLGNYGDGLDVDIGVGVSGPLELNNILGNAIEGNGFCGMGNFGVVGLAAIDNYWGAATGPGPDPADDVCNTGMGTTTVTPFALDPFPLSAPIKPSGCGC